MLEEDYPVDAAVGKLVVEVVNKSNLSSTQIERSRTSAQNRESVIRLVNIQASFAPILIGAKGKSPNSITRISLADRAFQLSNISRIGDCDPLLSSKWEGEV